MSDLAKQLFEGLKAVAPGLNDIVAETGAEMKRLGTQGAAELAAGLFSQSNAYTPYGAGQQPVEHEQSKEQDRGIER